MSVPPVFNIEEITPDLIDDLRDASQAYWYCDGARAFDELFTGPERYALIHDFVCGDVPTDRFAERIMERLLPPGHSTRSLGNGQMEAVAEALAQLRPSVAAIPDTLHLDEVDSRRLKEMADMFKTLDACAGVGATIASKLLAALRPALFSIWDNQIATAYGFALNPAGYHQFLIVTQAIAKKAREFWRWRFPSPVENCLWANGRTWKPPLAKVIHEWNWVRITRNTARVLSTESEFTPRPELAPVRRALRGLMRDIRKGRVQIRRLNSGASVHVGYETSNGWKLGVFNDAGDWDYLESAEDAHGSVLDYDEVKATRGVDWGRVANCTNWGILLYGDIDPDFPDESTF